jgi:hypothetical protein
VASDDLREVIKQLHDSHAKHVDLLIVIAGSCIALSVQRTTGTHPTWPMLFLAAAVLCWAVSIVAGLRNRHHVQAALKVNADLLRVESGEDPDVGKDPKLIQGASKIIAAKWQDYSARAGFLAHLQFLLLLVGAALFLVWHVVEMFRAPAAAGQ